MLVTLKPIKAALGPAVQGVFLSVVKDGPVDLVTVISQGFKAFAME